MCPIEEFIEKNVSPEIKLMLAKKFSNLFHPTTPFDNATCKFMYKSKQLQFEAFVFGYLQTRDIFLYTNPIDSPSVEDRVVLNDSSVRTNVTLSLEHVPNYNEFETMVMKQLKEQHVRLLALEIAEQKLSEYSHQHYSSI